MVVVVCVWWCVRMLVVCGGGVCMCWFAYDGGVCVWWCVYMVVACVVVVCACMWWYVCGGGGVRMVVCAYGCGVGGGVCRWLCARMVVCAYGCGVWWWCVRVLVFECGGV